MELADTILILSRMATGAVGTFFAILLWSQTRDLAWVLVIIGTLVSYVGIVFSTLEGFGILDADLLLLKGLPLFKIMLANLPMLFFAAGFLAAVFKRRFP